MLILIKYCHYQHIFFLIYFFSMFLYSSSIKAVLISPALSISADNINCNDYQENAEALLFLSTDTNKLLYTDITANYINNQKNLFSIGAGRRYIYNSNLILGEYGFIDTRAVFNPGIEIIFANHWDQVVNGFLPLKSSSVFQGQVLADQISKPQYIFFKKHQQYAEIFNQLRLTGKGLSIDTGYRFTAKNFFKYNHDIRLHGGGYIFVLPAKTGYIKGLEIGMRMPINNYFSIDLENDYNNFQKNTISLGLRFYIGSTAYKNNSGNSGSIQDYLHNDLYQHLGSLHSPDKYLIYNKYSDTKKSQLEKNNIWFFNSVSGEKFNLSNGMNNCTYERPCNESTINQDLINNINNINNININYFLNNSITKQHTDFYLSKGEYRISDGLLLNSYQSLYGRSTDYTKTDMPVLTGSLNLSGNNILEDFKLINSGYHNNSAITVINQNNIIINHLDIGGRDREENFSKGILLQNAKNIVVKNSVFNLSSSTDTAGLYIHNTGAGNSSVILKNNIFNIRHTGQTGPAIGIDNNPEKGSISIDMSQNIFNINGGGDFLAGIHNIDFQNGLIILEANNNQFKINSNGSEDFTAGINNMLFSQGKIIVNFAHNYFSLIAHGENGLSLGINNEASGGGIIETNSNNNNFNLSGNNMLTFGISSNADTNSFISVNAEKNRFNLSSSESSSYIYGLKNRADSSSESMINFSKNIFNLDRSNDSHIINIFNQGAEINDLGSNIFLIK